MKETLLLVLIGLLFVCGGIACNRGNSLLHLILVLIATGIHMRYFELKSDGKQKGGNDETV